MIETYLITGARRKELVEAKREDLVRRGAQERLRLVGKQSKHYRQATVREVVLPEGLAARLLALPERPEGLIFGVSNRKADRWLRAAADAAGFPDLVLHGLRHTAATLALKRGVPLETVRDFLGHSDISMTGRYVRAQKRFDEAPENVIAEALR